MQVKLTKIQTNKKYAKQYVLRNGTLTKQEKTTGEIVNAKAETIHLNSLHDLKTILDQASPDEMLILGHNKHTDNPFTIRANRYAIQENGEYGRTKENFVYGQHAVVLMDFDDLPNGMSIEDALNEFTEYYPSFKKSAKLICKSSSGSIKELEKNNYHVFVILEHSAHADKVFNQWKHHRIDKQLPILLDPALFTTQQNRVVFLKPVVPNGFTIDKQCQVIEGGLWDPSSEIVEEFFPELNIAATVLPKTQVKDLRDNHYGLLIERFNKHCSMEDVKELAVAVGCRRSNTRDLLFTPDQNGPSPKGKICFNGSHYFFSSIGKLVHDRKGYNPFDLVVKHFEIAGDGMPYNMARRMAICTAFDKIGGNDPVENAEAIRKLKPAVEEVISNNLFIDTEGFSSTQKAIEDGHSVFLKSVHGSGKTDHIVKKVVANLGKKILYVAPTVSLCSQAKYELENEKNELGQPKLSVMLYNDKDALEGKFVGADIVVSTPNSMNERVFRNGFKPEVIVVDEWVRVAASLTLSGDSFLKYDTRKVIIQALKNCGQVILLDADDSYPATKLAEYIGIEKFINNTHKAHTQPSYQLTTTRDWKSLFDLAVSYGNAFIFADSKKATDEISAGLSSKGKRVLTINADKKSEKEVAFLSNPNEEVAKYDYVIYSPSMNVGTSITSVEWPTIGLINGVVSPYDVLQGLRRSRRVGVVGGKEMPVTVFFQQVSWDSTKMTGELNNEAVNDYDQARKDMEQVEFRSDVDLGKLMIHLQNHNDTFRYVYDQCPLDSFIELLKHRGEKFDVVDALKDLSDVALNRKLASVMNLENVCTKVAAAKPDLPIGVYNSFTDRKAFEVEHGVEIVMGEDFIAERTKINMEMLLNIEDGWLDDRSNVKTVIEKKMVERALSFKVLRDSHQVLFNTLVEIGNGSHKSGDMNKMVIETLREYCFNEKGTFVEIPFNHRMELRKIVTGSYLTCFGFEFGKRVGDAKGKDFETVSGKVIAGFLRNLGIEVVVKNKRVNGSQTSISSLCPSSFIRGASMDSVEVSSGNNEHGKVIEMILQEIRRQ